MPPLTSLETLLRVNSEMKSVSVDKVGFNTKQFFVFDSDGTIINSLAHKNKIARETFRRLGVADESTSDLFSMMEGSRIEKLLRINREASININVEDFNEIFGSLLLEYADNFEVRNGLKDLRAATRDVTWIVATNGDAAETNKIYTQIKINHYFDGGIYGSPKSKVEILKGISKLGHIRAIFGDSTQDFQLAKEFNAKFIWFNDWCSRADFIELSNLEVTGYTNFNSVTRLVR